MKPEYEAMPVPHAIFSSDDVEVEGGQLGRYRLPLSYTVVQVGLGPEQAVPAYSMLGVFGWLPTRDSAWSLDPNRRYGRAEPVYPSTTTLSELKRVSGRARDSKRVSDVKRGLIDLPLEGVTGVLAAQAFREAEGRRLVIDLNGRDLTPGSDPLAALLQSLGRADVWLVAERAIEHRGEGELDIDGGYRRLLIHSEIPSSPAVRVLRPGDREESPVYYVEPYTQGGIRSNRGRVRVEATVEIEARRVR